ncbi:hypothetical protein GMRT_13118 [Giardia muris]|uniref:Uncharacterized protein n=1 Tax=Giardia muris TaxID=5742 RepID=A0A4Z1TBA2_GIAMU|nr:hypothetical protein GMRT_13118 [Giardia muris]|eukprot:TNJ30527.1 hypothetical protein GMRT_13118 [Giardia muris]
MTLEDALVQDCTCLQAALRDGRRWVNIPHITVEDGQADAHAGSAFVLLGDSEALCSISLRLIQGDGELLVYDLFLGHTAIERATACSYVNVIKSLPTFFEPVDTLGDWRLQYCVSLTLPQHGACDLMALAIAFYSCLQVATRPHSFEDGGPRIPLWEGGRDAPHIARVAFYDVQLEGGKLVRRSIINPDSRAFCFANAHADIIFDAENIYYTDCVGSCDPIQAMEAVRNTSLSISSKVEITDPPGCTRS